MNNHSQTSIEVDYENPGEHSPMGFMELGKEIHGSESASPQMDWKNSSFLYLTRTKNTRWETADVCMSMSEEAMRKATGRFTAPVDCWGCTNPPRYHMYRFHTKRNFHNKRDLDVAEQEKQSIQEYAQLTSLMGGSRNDYDSQRFFLEIFNVRALHVCRAEGSDHLILEREIMWITRPHTAYV